MPIMVAAAQFYASEDDETLYLSQIGSQAASMDAVSAAYGRWVRRTMAWVLRRGTKAWTWTNDGGTSGYGVAVNFANAIYALP